MIFLYQFQDIADVYLHLFHQFHLKDYIVIDSLLLATLPMPDTFVYGVIPVKVVGKRHRTDDLLLRCKFVKGTQKVPESQYLSHQSDEIFLLLFIYY